jgi:uncharacterized protein YjbJ (UPF0337 family)
MDKDRIAGAARGIKGSIKEAIGKVVGDAKLQSDGKAERTAGKIQNAVGGMKDTVREIVKGVSRIVFRSERSRREQ